jgi:hypothetical protein
MSELFLGNFSPTSFPGCAMWLDGADQTSASMTLSGTSLTLWKDKSGSGNNATPYNTSYATVNSNGVLFASQIYTTPYTSAPSTETAFVVFNVTAATYTGFQAILGSSVNGGRQLALLNGSPLIGLLKAQIAWQNTSAFTPGATTLGQGFINGSTAFSGVNGTYTATNTVTWSSGGFLYLGTEVSVPNGNYVGLMCEILIYNVVLTTDQTKQVEGYLAWKWGIQGSLPSVHPYKLINNHKSTGFPAAIQSLVNPLFTPANIPGLRVWFDASNRASITSNVSGQVSSWSNLAGYANAVQATTANMPYTGLSTLNSLNMMTFSNGDRLSFGPITYTSSNRSVFAVISTPLNPYTSQNFNLWIFGGGDDRGLISGFIGYQYQFSGFEISTTTFPGAVNVGVGYIAGTTGVLTNAGTYSNPWVFTYHKGSSANLYGINGTSYSAASNLGVGSLTDYFGSTGTGNTFYICEFIHYDYDLSVAQRQTVEGYLANKWNLKSFLPNTHPHYSVAPTVSAPLAIGQVYTTPPAQTFSYTGANQTYVVPAGTISLTVYIWGAGGGSSISPAGGGSGSVEVMLFNMPRPNFQMPRKSTAPMRNQIMVPNDIFGYVLETFDDGVIGHAATFTHCLQTVATTGALKFV